MKKNLEGLTPESWCCIDCGVNTAPGYPTRVEMEEAFGKGAKSVALHFSDESEVYRVYAHVWKAAGVEDMGGCLCIGCLEKRIGRELKPEDFDPDHPFNSGLPGTKRLQRRRTGNPFLGLELPDAVPSKGNLEKILDGVIKPRR
jgi:hypothetical protein